MNSEFEKGGCGKLLLYSLTGGILITIMVWLTGGFH
jgi:hypothetical protein